MINWALKIGKQDMIRILEPFHRCTLELEGHRGNGALYDMLPVMDIVLDHLENAKLMHTASTSPPHMLQSIDLAWQKLNKYYTMTESNAVLYAAIALHPAMKMEYFETNWADHPDWIDDARKRVEQL